jgi:hypothetical protein
MAPCPHRYVRDSLGVVRRAFAIVFVTGCYAPDIAPGTRCDPAVGCAGDLVCDVAAPGGPTCVRPGDETPDAPGDEDSDDDGIVDAADNCPAIANANQRDEDSDAVGNVCDNCPHRPNQDQPDTDRDSVGDACDPGPEQHAIVAFEDFADPMKPAAWVATPATAWTFVNGVARVTTANADVASLAFEPPTGARVSISTRFTLEVVNPAGANPTRNTGIAHHFDVAADLGTGCIGVVDQPAMTHTLWLLDLDSNATIDRVAFGDFVPGSTYELASTELLVGSVRTMRCHGTFGASVKQLEGSPVVGGPGVAIRTRGTTSVFDYVIVIAEQ